MSFITLHHGSRCVVAQPCLERCRPYNDYGQGFYCTQSKELAKEWACQQGVGGFVSTYELDVNKLVLIDLNSSDYSILHWLAVLLEHRLCRLSTPTMLQGSDWIKHHFFVDLSSADIVKGYRADDSYFGFARAFLRNEISLAQLARSLQLGELGEQYMIKSPKGFQSLRFVGSEPVDNEEYFPKRMARDKEARNAFREIVLQNSERAPQQATSSSNTRPIEKTSPVYITTLMSMSEEEIRACL